MNDEPWLRELAQVNREQRQDEESRLDERWDRLSRGELSPEEDAELRALAETSEEARIAYEAFRPLGPEFHASVVQAIRRQEPDRPAKLLPFRRRLAGWGSLAALAAAASVAAVLLRPLPPLPAYSRPEVSPGVSEIRGAGPETPVLAPGESFHVVVRPETAVAKGRRLEAFCILARDGELRPVEVRSEIDPGGSARMEGILGRDLPPGRWTLWAVVGRPGRLPDPAALRLLSPGARERDWVAVKTGIEIRPIEIRPGDLEDPAEN